MLWRPPRLTSTDTLCPNPTLFRSDDMLPAEGELASLLIEHGLIEVCGASVVDVLAVAWRSAIMMTRLRTDCNVKISRAGAYARRDPEDRKSTRLNSSH